MTRRIEYRRFDGIQQVGVTVQAVGDDDARRGDYIVFPTESRIRVVYVENEPTDGERCVGLNVPATCRRCLRPDHQAEGQIVGAIRLFTLLKSDKYPSDKYLSRVMRKHSIRGHNHTHNQIIVRSDDYTVFALEDGGDVWIKIPSLVKGKRIAIPLGTAHAPHGNLRLILKDGAVAVHYAVEEEKTNDCGSRTLGVDKGFTEVLTDSEGDHHGVALGGILSGESDFLKVKYQRRNKLKGIAQKKPWVLQKNLGRKKLDRRSSRHQGIVKTEVYTAVNAVVDKAGTIVTEDLSSPIAGSKFGKNVSRRLSSWTKGVIADAIENVSRRRGSAVVYVNAAYTSQMDSVDGTLSGKRRGDLFYRENGDVIQADVNASRNVKSRLNDPEIGRWTPFKQVKSILIARTRDIRLKLPNQDSSCRSQDLSTESELSNEYVCI